LADWSHLTSATYGEDYTLIYRATGHLAGYTLLTVGELPAPEPGTLMLTLSAASIATFQIRLLRS
ncbi:MAG: hypothetical protein KDA37_07795, partial [Planctomycetales bacterium]|nr:hypothetical protein [Planctomycetales bacterium]